MLCGPIFGSLLFVLGGFQLPFYVTGFGLFILTIIFILTFTEKENAIPDVYWSPNSGVLKKNHLSYFECFKSMVSN